MAHSHHRNAFFFLGRSAAGEVAGFGEPIREGEGSTIELSSQRSSCCGGLLRLAGFCVGGGEVSASFHSIVESYTDTVIAVFYSSCPSNTSRSSVRNPRTLASATKRPPAPPTSKVASPSTKSPSKSQHQYTNSTEQQTCRQRPSARKLRRRPNTRLLTLAYGRRR